MLASCKGSHESASTSGFSGWLWFCGAANMYIISLGMGNLFMAGKRQGNDLTEKKKWLEKEAETQFLIALFIYSGTIISITPEDHT